MSAYTRTGPFTNGAAPGIDKAFLDGVEDGLVRALNNQFTTTARDALTGADLWDGRLIWNTTTKTFDAYDLTATAWKGAAPDRAVISGFSYRVSNIVGAATQLLRVRANNINSAATMAAGQWPVVMDRAGSLVGITTMVDVARSAGTIACEVYKNGSATGLIATINGTMTQYAYTAQAAGLDTFVAGDRIDVRATVTSYTGGDYFECAVGVQYT